MQILVVDTRKRDQTRQFLDLPFEIYKCYPQWVPPLAGDARFMLNRDKHPFYKHGAAEFFLALEDDEPVGRLAVLKNDNFNAHNQDQAAFFYLFECGDHPQAAQGLFEAAAIWARKQGLTRIMGPRGFTVFDGLGMLVKGFEHRPAFGLPYNPPYYCRLVEAVGFKTYSELVSGYLDEKMEFPEIVQRGAELIMKRRGLRIAKFNTRQDLRNLIPHLKDLYNSSFTEGDGNIPLTDEDVMGIANQMLWFADPKLIKIVMKDEQPVGFLVAYPDISAAIQRTGGKMFPLGWLQMIIELKRTKWININGAGMVEAYRGSGGTAILFSEMYKSVAESRYRFADLVQIGTENDNMQREMRKFGIDFYKTHRMYEWDI